MDAQLPEASDRRHPAPHRQSRRSTASINVASLTIGPCEVWTSLAVGFVTFASSFETNLRGERRPTVERMRREAMICEAPLDPDADGALISTFCG